jgi:hypothetical protein
MDGKICESSVLRQESQGLVGCPVLFVLLPENADRVLTKQTSHDLW